MAQQAEAPWLDDDEMAAWLGLVSVVIRLPVALDAQLRRDADVSHFEYQVMAVLSQRDGRTLPMTEIAAFTEGSLSRLSHAVTRLESDGWVTRAPAPHYRRVTMATLTGAGVAKMVSAAPGHVGAVRRLVFDSLTKTQVAQLTAITRRLTSAVDADLG